MTKDRLIEEYQVFFKNNNNSGLSFYGLIPMEVRGASMIYDRPYTETLQVEFDFDDTCIWEDIEDDETVAKIIERVQFGNITIAKEGCGTYWILIVNGPKAGEVWLLTEFGVTPVKERLTLTEWKELQMESKILFGTMS